jgi:hypothetical protein
MHFRTLLDLRRLSVMVFTAVRSAAAAAHGGQAAGQSAHRCAQNWQHTASIYQSSALGYDKSDRVVSARSLSPL